jgi:hypothetical protein
MQAAPANERANQGQHERSGKKQRQQDAGATGARSAEDGVKQSRQQAPAR